MPRDGSTIFHKPFPDVINNTTIESAVYNGFVNDIESDMNNPRPILSGGTGANNARDAMLNLKGEIALQQVANFDSHPWVPGSFYSAIGASAAPNNTHAFTGDYFQNATGDHATIHARANTGTPYGILYVRQKIAGVWSAWFDTDKVMDDKKVNRIGDVMTGDLFIDKANPALVLDKAATAEASYLVGQNNALARWRLDLGDSVPEGGTQAGSNFTLRRYTNAGVLIDTPLSIARDTGTVTMPGSITVGGTINTTGTATFSGPLTATNITATGNLAVSGTAAVTGISTFTGASTFNSDITVKRGATPATGYIFYGSSGSKYLGFDGTNFQFSGGAVLGTASIQATTSLHAGTSIHAGSTITAGSTISTSGSVNGAGHSTFGNLTANGGVVYLAAANNYYIQQAGGVLNFNGQPILHSGNYTSYIPAAVTSQYWAHVGDYTFFAFAHGAPYEPYGAHCFVAGMWSGGSSGHGVRYRALYNYISGGAYVVGAAS